MTRSRVSWLKAPLLSPAPAAERLAARMSALPRLLVMMMTAFLKLTVRPWSVTDGTGSVQDMTDAILTIGAANINS